MTSKELPHIVKIKSNRVGALHLERKEKLAELKKLEDNITTEESVLVGYMKAHAVDSFSTFKGLFKIKKLEDEKELLDFISA